MQKLEEVPTSGDVQDVQQKCGTLGSTRATDTKGSQMNSMKSHHGGKEGDLTCVDVLMYVTSVCACVEIAIHGTPISGFQSSPSQSSFGPFKKNRP